LEQVTDGRLFTTTVEDAVAVQPPVPETTTVYVPETAGVAAVMAGLAAEELNPAGPLHA